jgi:glycosyltransferase involved in cell wall biosynthesis
LPAAARDRLVHGLSGLARTAGADLAHGQGRLRLRCKRGRRPRVLVSICWTFPVYSHSFVYQELLQLQQAGFEVQILFSEAGDPAQLGDSFRALRARAATMVCTRRTGARDLAHFRRRAPHRVAALFRVLELETGLREAELLGFEHVLYAFTFARHAESYAADYIHSYFFYESTLFAAVAAAVLGLPRGVSCYADHMLADYRLKLVRLHLAQAQIVVATSNRIGRELAAINPAAAPRILVKPNAVDARDWPPQDAPSPAAPPVVVAVSRIDRKKGLEHLVGAARLLRDRGIDVLVRILGAPDANDDARAYAAGLRAQIDASGLGGRVDMAGMADRAAVRAALRDATVFAVPAVDLANGDKDGIPTALLEAMACSLAVVATDAGSIAEVIADGHNGLCVPQRDRVALADAIARLLIDPEHRRALGRHARQTVLERLDVSVCEARFHAAVRASIGAAA